MLYLSHMEGVGVDLRDLRYFVAVADELHFSRAAARLHLDQPTLSRRVRRLERQLGVELLRRTTRSVALTDAGRAFLERARDSLAAADAAIAAAREAANGHVGVLRIGMMAQIATELRANSLRVFSERYPNVEANVLGGYPYVDPTCGLVAGGSDVAFVWEPIVHPEIETRTLFEEPRYVVFSDDHRFARQAVVTVDDLEDEPVCGFPAAYYDDPTVAAWGDAFQLQPRPDGTRRRVGAVVTNRDEWVDALIRGKAVSPTPYSTAQYYHWPGVTFAPLEGALPIKVAIAWRRDRSSPVVSNFVEVVRDLAA
jgi:DNA-binding transcriptional LysR family regulator